MKRLIEIFGIIFLGILFLYCIGQSQTQRPVVLTVLGGAIPQDSLSNKIYVKDSSITNNTAGYYVSTTMGMTLAPKASPTFSGTVTHTGNFISATSNGTPRVTVGSVAGTGSGNFIADTITSGRINATNKSNIDSLVVDGRLGVGMSATSGQAVIKASATVANALELYRGSSTTAVMKVDTSGTINGVALVRGTGTFTAGANEDTLVVSGFASGDILVVSPVINAAADTTGFKSLFVRSVTTDTAFVLQVTAGNLNATKYNYWRVK